MSKRAILWTAVLVVAFASGFGVGASLWKYNAYNYIRGEPTTVSDTLNSS
jgi:hypothetical protein